MVVASLSQSTMLLLFVGVALLSTAMSLRLMPYRATRLPLSMANQEVEITNLDNNTKVTLPAGSFLSLAAARSGMKLSFQCKQGSCQSCETLLDGKVVRTCITKVPDKKKVTLKKKT